VAVYIYHVGVFSWDWIDLDSLIRDCYRMHAILCCVCPHMLLHTPYAMQRQIVDSCEKSPRTSVICVGRALSKYDTITDMSGSRDDWSHRVCHGDAKERGGK
jgi:hypothetical protein